MPTYLLINIIIFLIPFLFSFEKRIRFIQYFPHYLKSICIVSSVYIIWDVIFTTNGVWGFSENHLIGINVLYLPLEEILFFITVSYASLFIYENVELIRKTVPLLQDIKVSIEIPKYLVYSLFTLVFLVSFLFLSKAYTFVILLVLAVTIIIPTLLNSNIFSKVSYWLTMFATYIPFFIVNYILTSIPIVWYNPEQFSNVRITTIPIEDFIYSYTMITLWILFYTYSKDKSKSKLKSIS